MTSRTTTRRTAAQGRRRTVPSRRHGGIVTGIIVVLGIAYYLLHSLILPNIDSRWETCTVTAVTAVGKVHGGTDYRIYTRQCDVLEDGDDFLRGKSDSATVFGQITPGGTYSFHLVGVRFSPFSNFPNILGFTPVTFHPAKGT